MRYRITPILYLGVALTLSSLLIPLTTQANPKSQNVSDIKGHLTSTSNSIISKTCESYQSSLLTTVRNYAVSSSSESLRKERLPPLGSRELRQLIQELAQNLAEAEENPEMRKAIKSGIRRFMSTGRIDDMERGMKGFQEACTKKLSKKREQLAQGQPSERPDYNHATTRPEPREIPEYLKDNLNAQPATPNGTPRTTNQKKGFQLPKQGKSTLRR